MQSNAVVKTTVFMEQHCVRVVYKIRIVTPLLFTTFFTGRLGTLAEFFMDSVFCHNAGEVFSYIDF